MAKRVTEQDIKKMFEVYATCGNYNQVAEATGWSETTVRKYLNMEHPFENVEFEVELPSMSEIVKKLTNK